MSLMDQNGNPHLGFLHVVVQSGHGLPAADFNIFQKSTSDPYVILTFGEQKYRTGVKAKTLNPIWGEACTFQVGSFTHISGVTWTDHGDEGQEHVLLVEAMDKDTWSEDDPLGKGVVRLDDVYRHPGVWCRKEVKLKPPRGVLTSGSIRILVLYQREFALPFYTVRLAPAIGHFVGGAMLLIAAHCRWQHQPSQEAVLMQPGVGACVLLAGILSWAAGVIEFLAIHLGWSFDKRMLAKNSVASGLHHSIDFLHKRFPLEEAHIQHTESIMSIKAKALGLSEYQINLSLSRCDIQLPVLIILALLPHAAEALGILALLLQCQDWSISLCAGELLDVGAVLLEIASVNLALLVAILLEPTAEGPQQSPSRLLEDISKMKSFVQAAVHPHRTHSMREGDDNEDYDEAEGDGESDQEASQEESVPNFVRDASCHSERRVGWVRSAIDLVWTPRRTEHRLSEPLLGHP